MPNAPAVFRASIVLLLAAVGLAACSGVGSNPPPSPGAPSPGAPSATAVVTARYATPVDLDRGGLLITPPPAGARATVPVTEATSMFEATDAVQGPYAFSILGLGIVTVAAWAERTAPPAPTATAPPSATTTAPPSATTTAPPSATTTAPPSATTTAPPSPSSDASTTAPAATTTTAPPTPALPSYRHRLAWVGIAWGTTGTTGTCPGSTTTGPASAGTTSYVAVVIDARTGHQVLAYQSGVVSPCGGAPRPPAVTEPNELVSVSWQPVGPASTAVRIQIPPCGRYYGWTQRPTTGTGIADQVVVAVPFDPSCGSAVSQSQLVDQVVPLGAGQALVGHAALGPIQALRTLPTT